MRRRVEHATCGIESSRVHYGIGEAYHRKGDFEASIRGFDLALGDVGFPRPTTRAGRLIDTLMNSVYFHALPRWCRPPLGGADGDDRTERVIASYMRLCQIYGQRNIFEYTHNSYKVVAFAKQSRNPEFIAIAYSKLGLNCAMFGLYWLGMSFIRCARKATELCRRDEVKATAEAHIGCALYMSGQLDAAESSLRGCVAILDKVGDWFGMFSHHTLRHIHSVRGDIRSELAEAEQEIALGTARGDRVTLSWGLYGKADGLARAGNFAEAENLAARSVEELTSLKSNTAGLGLGVLGFVRLQASDYAGAREALERSRSRLVRDAFVIEYGGPTFPLLVESLLGPNWAQPRGGQNRAIDRKAWREARTARCIGWIYPNYRPHALRVSGRAAFTLGKTKAAASYFERSIAAAEKLGARYDLARAYLDASLVIPEKADDYRRRGQQLLDELGAVVPDAERSPSSTCGPESF